MARLIDADELARLVKKSLDVPGYGDYYSGYDAALNTVLDYIADAPTVPEYGQWIKTTENNPKLPDCECCKVTVITYRIGDTSTHPMIYERETVRGINVTRWKLLRNRLSDYVPDYWMSMPEPPEVKK